MLLDSNRCKTCHGYPITWHTTLDDFLKISSEKSSKEFTVFLANEFFDSLPIHQFQRGDDKKWREIYVNIDQQNKLCFMLSRNENIHTTTLIPKWIDEDLSRTYWECCPEAVNLLMKISDRISQHGGFSLIFDYGHEGLRKSNSLRAYQNHALVDPLSNIGQIDLTADVDFGHIKTALENKCLVFGPVEQRRFLYEMGIFQRLEQLLKKCREPTHRESLLKSFKFLINDMGVLFKVRMQ